MTESEPLLRRLFFSLPTDYLSISATRCRAEDDGFNSVAGTAHGQVRRARICQFFDRPIFAVRFPPG